MALIAAPRRRSLCICRASLTRRHFAVAAGHVRVMSAPVRRRVVKPTANSPQDGQSSVAAKASPAAGAARSSRGAAGSSTSGWGALLFGAAILGTAAVLLTFVAPLLMGDATVAPGNAADVASTDDPWSLELGDDAEGAAPQRAERDVLGDEELVTRYAVVLDAGSSGTRVYVYRWDACDETDGSIDMGNEAVRAACHAAVLSSFNELGKLRTNPGLSSLAGAEDLQDGVSFFLQPLLRFAADRVPAPAQPTTRIVLHATAGLRLLSPTERVVIEAVARRELEESVFHLADDADVRTVAGAEEAVDLFVSVNTALCRLGASAATPLAAVLDLGGASTQIAFPVVETGEDETGSADGELVLNVAGEDVRLYATTRLRYGLGRAFGDYVNWELERASADTATSPCALQGSAFNGSSTGTVSAATGGPQFAECASAVREFVSQREADPRLNPHVPPQPVAPRGVARSARVLAESPVAAPAPDGRQLWFAADNFWKVASRVLSLGGSVKELAPYVVSTVAQLEEAAAASCGGQLSVDGMRKKLPKTNSMAADELCFDVAYVRALFGVYGIALDTEVHFVRDLPKGCGDVARRPQDWVQINWPQGVAMNLAGVTKLAGLGEAVAAEAAADQYARSVE